MTSVTIEQNLESRQTYLRFKGVGRLLRNPQFGIASDSNEMLSPGGWKNQDIANQSRQCLDGDDLLLEMDSRLINHIEPGRAIEITVAELSISERILPPPLLSFPANAPPLPGTKVYKFEGSRSFAPEPPPPPPPPLPSERDADETRLPFADMPPPPPPSPMPGDAYERTVEFSGDREADDEPGHTRLVDGDPEPATEDFHDGETRRVEDDVEPDEPEGDEAELADDGAKATGPKPEPGRPSLVVLAAAVIAGLVVGFFSKYIVDEYSPWAAPATNAGANRKIALLETDAFGPLAEDLKRMPDKSPAGLAPDAVPGIGPTLPNRSRTYFNYAAKEALEGNKAEATYWYKRSVLTIEPEALTFLGDAYLNGDGVPRDARTGYQLLRLATGLGNDKARNYLIERLGNHGIPNAPPTMADAYRGR